MRYLSLILFALVLAAPFALRRALVAQRPRTGASGPAERLVIITPQNQDIRNEFARAFSPWHVANYGTAVELDFRVPGGTSDVKRQLEATYKPYRDAAGQLPADVPAAIQMVWGGGDFLHETELKPLGILQPIQLTSKLREHFLASFPSPTLAGVRLYDATTAAGQPTPQWIGICLSSFGICYNPDVYRALGLREPSAERGWQDLADPRLAGMVALADPAHAGSAAVAYQMVIQHKMAQAEAELFAAKPALRLIPAAEREKNADYDAAMSRGWDAGMTELLKIAANARYFTDSSTLVPMDVSRGEAAAGVAIDFYARVTEESVGKNRMQYVAPIGATAITPDPIAILRGVRGRNLELAEHFIEFLLSPEGQKLWDLKPGVPGGPVDRSLRRMPVRRDLYADRTGWADDIDPFQIANGFNQRGQWMTLFTDSRPIWVAAWIDSRDALLDAYRQILAVQDEGRRLRLIDQLASLPIKLADVRELRNKRKQLEKSRGELDEWRAVQQIEWAERFRQHYRKIAAQARGQGD